MNHAVKHLGSLLKNARREKGLSQHALGQKVGIPQSHLSNIEGGLVDLQTSSLIELARALDLEVMLVPRILVNTVNALKRGMDEKDSESRPMYQVDKDGDEE